MDLAVSFTSILLYSVVHVFYLVVAFLNKEVYSSFVATIYIIYLFCTLCKCLTFYFYILLVCNICFVSSHFQLLFYAKWSDSCFPIFNFPTQIRIYASSILLHHHLTAYYIHSINIFTFLLQPKTCTSFS